MSAMAGTMMSRIRRTRARRKPSSVRARRAALASCCGENFRTVSAIARFHFAVLVARFLLHGLPQVLLDGAESHEQLRHVGAVEPGERLRHQVLAQIGQPL